jgi:spermidine synthase
MFAQVLHNSVYTFSSILTVFLLMLAVAAAFSNALMRLKIKPIISLNILLILGGILTIASAFVFSEITAGLDFISADQGWWQYILKVLGIALLVMGPALLCLGAILPLTFKLAEQQGESVGQIVGKLTAINTLGAVLGSLLAGFILLEAVGLWQAIRLVACLYLVAALLLMPSNALNQKFAAIPVALVLLFVSFLDLSGLPVVKLDDPGIDEKLVELWEGSAGTVAVVHSKKQGGLSIKVNNHYTLGSTGATVLEEIQTDIPLLLHPNPKKVYMLGLGTGITAGAALNYPIAKLTVTELVPDVIVAARKYFSPFLHGLFSDQRAEVIAEDGRNFLKGTASLYDVIIADLFVLWKAGSGYLYTQEHFQAVSDRLEKNGLFMQWLPSHQMTETQFRIITKTMLSVFPQVTLWRSDFLHGVSLIGLLGQKQVQPLSAMELNKNVRAVGLDYKTLPLLCFYIGNLGAQKDLFNAAELNRDDFPVIVYDAPITQRLYLARKINYLTGNDLIELTTLFNENYPLENDAFLSNVSPSNKQLVPIGALLHQAETLKGKGEKIAATRKYTEFKEMFNDWKQVNQASE